MFSGISGLKLVALVGVIGGTTVCGLCEVGSPAGAQAGVLPQRSVAQPIAQRADTAIARLHISGMTCGTCPVTARVALNRVPGVYSAVVTLPDSLGIVRYDAARVSAVQIATRLTKLTGYGATPLSDSENTSRLPSPRNGTTGGHG